MRKKTPEKIDLRKRHKQLYAATRRVVEVNSPRGAFLTVEGRGEPGGPVFQAAIEKLYSVGYTLKWSLKMAGVLDFGVPCLECLYTSADMDAAPPKEWAWTFLLRIPDEVTAREVSAARAEVKQRRALDAADVKRRRLREGRCLQTLHVGPYGEVGPVYERLNAYAAANGLQVSGPPHEVYVNDPRRVAPEKVKTVVRLPVKRAASAARKR
jgi:hypothetical protein